MYYPPVICDTGTGVIKAGFAGDKEPVLSFPNLLGRPMLRYDAALGGNQKVSDLEIGNRATELRAMLQLSRPIQNGIIQNWDDMEAVWDYTWDKLQINPAEHKVVQTEAALNPARNRERMVETMFERYGFDGVNISIQAIMALSSQGYRSGFVVDSGDGVTHLVPVADGYLEPALVERVNLAGRHVTEHLMKLLVGQGHPLNYKADMETVREMKQKLCYVAYDLQAEQKLARETTLVQRQYTLPDTRVMRIGAERFLAPEILFTPSDDANGMGLAQLVYNTIRKSDMHVQKDYFSHILLAGGTTMFPGLSSRLEKDLRKLYVDQVLQGDQERAKRFRCIVEDPPQRQHMVFLGASVSAKAQVDSSNSTFFMSRKEYEDCGARAVQRLIPTKLS